MNHSLPLPFAVPCCLVVLLIGWAWSHALSGDDGVLRIGVCVSLTGEFHEHGKIELAGIAIGIDELNADPASSGRRVVPVVKDVANDPKRVDTAMRELAEDGIRLVIGPVISNLVPSIRKAALDYDMVAITPSATYPGLGRQGDRVFSVMVGDDFQGAALATFITKRLSMRRVAVLFNSNNPYSQSITGAFKEALIRMGGTVVQEERYAVSMDDAYETDFLPLLQRIMAASPEIVLLPGYHDEVASILSQATLAGIKIPFCGGDAWDTESLFLAAGKSIEGSYYIALGDPGRPTPLMEHFLGLLDQTNDPHATPSSVTGYDSVILAMAALRDGDDPARMIANLYGLSDFPLATGAIAIDPEIGTLKTVYIAKVFDTGGNTFVGRVVDRVEPQESLDALPLPAHKE